jgi:hypothetical protein
LSGIPFDAAGGSDALAVAFGVAVLVVVPDPDVHPVNANAMAKLSNNPVLTCFINKHTPFFMKYGIDDCGFIMP